MTTDSSLRQINDEIFECQQTHCQLHHGGLLRVYPRLCLMSGLAPGSCPDTHDSPAEQ
jgi:hypothetical protein